MATKSLDRLMFVQGGLCFFCKKPVSKADASVEHLLASAKAGSNHDDNCVVCCKSFNALLGSMSLKEKFQVLLNQKGQFKCPNGDGSARVPPQPAAKPKQSAASKSKTDRFTMVVANLKQRGASRPLTLKTLRSTIASLFPKGISEADLTALIQRLQSSGEISVTENKVSYAR
jgi:hypothetical protein